MGRNIELNGRKFIMTETESEVILSTVIGKLVVENIFKKDTEKDIEILSSLERTLKNALHENLENITKSNL